MKKAARKRTAGLSLIDRILKACRADDIPAGQSGLWTITKFRAIRQAFPEDWPADQIPPPGNYTSLFCLTDASMHEYPGELVMHDYPYELRRHLDFILRASGRVLVTGLGLGCVVRGLLYRRAVSHVTVVEKSADVMNLVAPHMPKTNRLEIVHADARDYVETCDPFECVWHDLWVPRDAVGEESLPFIHTELIARTYDAGAVERLQGCWDLDPAVAKMIKGMLEIKEKPWQSPNKSSKTKRSSFLRNFGNGQKS